MKKIIFILLFLFFSSSCMTFAAEEFNFRGVTWGMTKEDVLNLETAELIENEPGYLCYKVQDFHELEAEICYWFHDSILDRIDIECEGSGAAKAYEAFSSLREFLLNTYYDPDPLDECYPEDKYFIRHCTLIINQMPEDSQFVQIAANFYEAKEDFIDFDGTFDGFSISVRFSL